MLGPMLDGNCLAIQSQVDDSDRLAAVKDIFGDDDTDIIEEASRYQQKAASLQRLRCRAMSYNVARRRTWYTTLYDNMLGKL